MLTPVDSFTGKLAVVTGGGSGIGRELVRQLAAQGCSVAACDLNPDSVAVTAATTWAAAPRGVRVTGHACDVSDEAQVQRFRDELLAEHASDHVDLVFANAGVFGGTSFDHRLQRVEFAIKGFSEALIEDLRSNAPQVRVVVVMPGVVNTDIAENSRRALGLPAWEQLSDAELLEQIPDAGRAVLVAMGLLAEDFSADDLRQAIPRIKDAFRGQGFLPAQAAVSILEGVRSGAWRILVGEEAKMLDEQVRANPEAPFDYEHYAEMYGPLIAQAQAEAEASGTPEP